LIFAFLTTLPPSTTHSDPSIHGMR
jgi:hypothetical protein